MSLLSFLLTASVSFAAQKSGVPPIPAAQIPGLPASAAVSASPVASGPLAVAQQLDVAGKAIAPQIEAAQKGAAGDAAGAGRGIQAALEGGKTAAVTAEVVPVPQVEDALRGVRPIRAAFGQALSAAAAFTEKAKLPKPRFLEGERTYRSWEFSFIAGKRAVIVYVYDAPGQKPGAGSRGDWDQEPVSQALNAAAFSRKVAVAPRVVAEKAAKIFGTTVDKIGLALEARNKSGELYYIADTEDGRRLLFKASAKATPKELPSAEVDRKGVEAAASSAASHKGYPWSHTEYNLEVSLAESSLMKRGATRAQLKLFRELLARAPIRGGRFNSWSGD